MFTAKIVRKQLDLPTKSIYVDVEFTDGVTTFGEQFKFGLDISFETIQRQIKRFIEMYNNAEAKADAIPVSTLDLSGVVVNPEPTAAEQEKANWFRDFGRLERVQQLITLGVLTGTETAVTNLRNRVKTNFKPAYIADM